MTDIFKAIADPTRREILLMLCKKPTSVNGIAEHFDMSRPAVSKHIKILQSNNLVDISSDNKDGRQRNCYAQLEALEEVNAYMKNLHKFWNQKLDNLGAFLDEQAD